MSSLESSPRRDGAIKEEEEVFDPLDIGATPSFGEIFG